MNAASLTVGVMGSGTCEHETLATNAGELLVQALERQGFITRQRGRPGRSAWLTSRTARLVEEVIA
jgi:hypothetical protein